MAVIASDLKNDDILLELENIQMAFGKVVALGGVNLQIRTGEIHSVFGASSQRARHRSGAWGSLALHPRHVAQEAGELVLLQSPILVLVEVGEHHGGGHLAADGGV